MNSSPFFEIALSEITRIGAVTARQLISYCGSAEAVFHTSRAKLLRIPQIGAQTASIILEHQKSALDQAEKILKKAEKDAVKIYSYFAPDYPQRLKHIHDAPLVFYYQGNASLNPPRSVAIVGTREASNYGKAFTEELVKDLHTYQVQVVSGLAYGIDIAAHRACLKYHVPTIAVMASGIDIIYPAVHKSTARDMLQSGGVLTESSFGTKPDAARFPARNRIIAGLSDAVIVVEAKRKGGALITAEIANNYHRDVFAVPGNVHSKTSEGCHGLIKNHKANLICTAADLAFMMNWDTPNNPTATQKKLNFSQLDLDASDQKIITCLQDKPNEGRKIDELSLLLNAPVHQLQSRLLQLELQGLVTALPGKRFVINA